MPSSNYEVILRAQKKYWATEKGIKSRRKVEWKKRGLDMEDFETAWNEYWNATQCYSCGIELVQGNCRNGKSMDHDHSTGKFRAILCKVCNTMEGIKGRDKSTGRFTKQPECPVESIEGGS